MPQIPEAKKVAGKIQAWRVGCHANDGLRVVMSVKSFYLSVKSFLLNERNKKNRERIEHAYRLFLKIKEIFLQYYRRHIQLYNSEKFLLF